MKRQELIQAIKDVTSEHTKQWASESKAEELYFAEGNGVPTWHISTHLGVPAALVRKELKKMQQEGLVYGFTKRGRNQINWWPVGYLAELRSTPL